MLQIINILKPFFEDCYRRINVREYGRIIKVSPPTASKILKNFEKEKILKKEREDPYLYYYANKDSDLFIDLSRIYWKSKLKYSKYLAPDFGFICSKSNVNISFVNNAISVINKNIRLKNMTNPSLIALKSDDL